MGNTRRSKKKKNKKISKKRRELRKARYKLKKKYLTPTENSGSDSQQDQKGVNRPLSILRKYKWHIFTLSVLLLITLIFHGWNMFDYPYYENDEGTYLSRGWSFLYYGRLDPYTYWYDHVPFASFMLAFWIFITGGIDTFGMSVNSGRVFMLILHLIDIILIYYIGLRMTGRKLMGITAAIIFSISPLSIYFYRRLLLDNIIIFWMLLPLAILVKRNLTLRWIIFSGVAFALGVLTKENVVLFLPVYLGIVWFRTKSTSRLMGAFLWLAFAGGLISLYFLYALFKQEFFFPGMLGTPEESVSLLHTLKFHLGRGNELPFWEEGSDFMGNFLEWYRRDKYYIYFSVISTIALIPLTFKHSWARVLIAFSAIHLWFLMRGGLILNFYIIPVLPLMALNIGYVFDYVFNVLLKEKEKIRTLILIGISVFTIVYIYQLPRDIFTRDENEPFRKTVEYARENFPEDAMIVTDNAIYLDLVGTKKHRSFPNTEWFWKIDNDPDVYEDQLKNDWKSINYVLLSHETVKQMASGDFKFVQYATENGDILVKYDKNSTSYVNLDQYLSTNGDWSWVIKLPEVNELQKRKIWEDFKNRFLISYGQIYDDGEKQTTANMQTTAMMMAVLTNDSNSFIGLKAWTNDHFGYRQGDELLSSVWSQESVEAEGTVTDTSATTRADMQYAAALLMAYEKWGVQEYLDEARIVLADIWKYEVIELRSRYYIGSGSSAPIYNPQSNIVDRYYIDILAGNPMYLELFEKYDPETDWDLLLEDWYIQAETLLSFRGEGMLRDHLPDRAILSLDGSFAIDGGYLPYSLASTSFLLGTDPKKESDRALFDLVAVSEDSLKEYRAVDPYTVEHSQQISYLLNDELVTINRGRYDPEKAIFQQISEKDFSFENGQFNKFSDYINIFKAWSIAYKLSVQESISED